MSTNYRFNRSKAIPFRIHMDEDRAIEQITEQIETLILPYWRRDLVLVCIGTDRSTGDSLGPLIGKKIG